MFVRRGVEAFLSAVYFCKWALEMMKQQSMRAFDSKWMSFKMVKRSHMNAIDLKRSVED